MVAGRCGRRCGWAATAGSVPLGSEPHRSRCRAPFSRRRTRLRSARERHGVQKLPLTYGISAQSLAAALGIALSLGFAALVGTLAVDSAALDGRSGELSSVLSQTNAAVSLQGIVLAGLVIGALGVLADMGVTQAAAVMALRRANVEQSAFALYCGAFTVGRDHLVATTHTLVRTYVGASLPLLLVLRTTGVALPDAFRPTTSPSPSSPRSSAPWRGSFRPPHHHARGCARPAPRRGPSPPARAPGLTLAARFAPSHVTAAAGD